MENNLRKARLKTSNIVVMVYPHKHNGKWVNYADCSTLFDKIDLEFLDK